MDRLISMLTCLRPLINHNEKDRAMNDLGSWDVHPLLKLPLHRSKCQVCEDYRNHVFAMEKVDGNRVIEEMARLWEPQEVGSLRKENQRLIEEVNSGRAEIERLKILLEVERSRSAERSRSRSPTGPPGRASLQENTCPLASPREAKLITSANSAITSQIPPGTVVQITLLVTRQAN
jgi:hypothetical protein